MHILISTSLIIKLVEIKI